MTHAITNLNNYLWLSIEEAVTPIPKQSKNSRILHVLPAIIFLPGALLTGLAVSVISVAEYAARFFISQPTPNPLKDFSAVCNDSRLWKLLEPVQDKVHLATNNPTFLFGAATATYQDSGSAACPNSQWVDWENEHLAKDNRSQESASLFKLYQTAEGMAAITNRLQALGVNSYRFSLEWSQIQPTADTFDLDVLQIYVRFCKHLRDQGISPMITLQHFSEPKWFHALGSFEKEENIAHFVQYATKVFPELTATYKGKPLVEHFCTINEPAVDTTFRYINGEFSPGHMLQFEKAGNFLKTTLKAHTLTYSALKQIKPEVQIGIVHPRFSCIAKNPLVSPFLRYLNRLTNETALNFFKTGTFEFKMPFLCNIVEEGLNPKTDFVGLQYYFRPLIGLLGSTSYYEPMTEMGFREDPEGLYVAIKEVHEAYKVPVIVTENGVSTHDDAQRSRYMIRALYAAQRAVEEIGEENLKGYYVWSFCDNFEWQKGLNPQRFGAFSVEGGESGRLFATAPKPGMDTFIKVTSAWKESNKMLH